MWKDVRLCKKANDPVCAVWHEDRRGGVQSAREVCVKRGTRPRLLKRMRALLWFAWVRCVAGGVWPT
jgi:hypothetical protein